MVNNESTGVMAEKFSKMRVRYAPFHAGLLILTTAVGIGRKTSDYMYEITWSLQVLACMLVLFNFRGWGYPRAVRILANDESVRFHQANAVRWAFIASISTCAILYAVTFLEALGGRDTIHWVVTTGVAVGVFRLGYLERRAHRDA